MELFRDWPQSHTFPLQPVSLSHVHRHRSPSKCLARFYRSLETGLGPFADPCDPWKRFPQMTCRDSHRLPLFGRFADGLRHLIVCLNIVQLGLQQ